MSSRALVDPELLPVLDMFSSEPISLDNLPALRAAMAEQIIPVGQPAEGITMEEQWIPSLSEDHQIRVLIYRPEQVTDNMPAILEIHGGGYVVGAPEMSDASNRYYAQSIGGVVVAVDYRLSPETPHPGPVEDCYSALKWLHDNAEQLQINRQRIGILGGSAGGGLAAALTLLARDRQEVPIALQVLLMPMLDDRTVTRYEKSPHPYAGEFVFSMPSNRFGWSCLLGQEPGSDDISYYAAPARADDLSGLPATFISTGALDLFVEENLDYARRLIHAGVATELHVYPGAIHGFAMMTGSTVAKQDKQLVTTALTRVLCQ